MLGQPGRIDGRSGGVVRHSDHGALGVGKAPTGDRAARPLVRSDDERRRAPREFEQGRRGVSGDDLEPARYAAPSPERVNRGPESGLVGLGALVGAETLLDDLDEAEPGSPAHRLIDRRLGDFLGVAVIEQTGNDVSRPSR